jgi:integrase
MRAKSKLTADSVRRYDGRDNAGTTAVKWCIDPRGFGVRLNKDTGHKAWIVKFRNQPQTIGRVDVMPLDEARDLAKKILGELKKGIDRRVIAAAAMTFEQVLTDYCKVRTDAQMEDQLRQYSSALYQRTARTHLADWKDTPLKDITRAMVLEKYESILANVKVRETQAAKERGREPNPRKTGAGSANLVARIISLVWNHGVELELEGLPDRNPVHKLKRRRRKLMRRDDHVPLADLRKFHDAVKALGAGKVDHPERDAILLALYTGLRKGNVTRLRWDQIDWDNCTIRLTGDDMKSTRDFNLPLHDLAIDLLRTRDEHRAIPDSSYVFAKLGGGHITELARPLAATTEAAGIEHVSVHGLRRSYASIAYAAELTMEQVGMMLDHSKPNTITGKYVQGIEQKMAVWAAQVGAFLADKIGAGPGGNVKPFRRPKDTDPMPAVAGDLPAVMTA